MKKLLCALLVTAAFAQSEVKGDSKIGDQNKSKKAKTKVKWEASLIPEVSMKAPDGWGSVSDSGSFEQGLATAQIKLNIKPSRDLPVGVHLSVNFAKSTILRNAYIYAPLVEGLELQAGRYKIPFGLDFRRGTSDLRVHGRSHALDDLKSLIGESRLTGMGLEYQSPWGQELNLHAFESNNVLDFPGLEIIQTLNAGLEQEIGESKVGVSWLSEAFKLTADQYYRAHYYTAYSEIEVGNWFSELETVKFDTQVRDYDPSLGLAEDQINYSHRALVQYAFPLGQEQRLAPLVQYERQDIDSGNQDYFTQGLYWYLDNEGKKPLFGVSLNNQFAVQDGLTWTQVGMRVLYRVGLKGKY